MGNEAIENLYIRKTNKTPEVDFNAKTGILNISGESWHEYSLEFFVPIFDWLKHYTKRPGKKIEMNFNLGYYNSSSSRRFLEIMNLLEDYRYNKGGQVTINGPYDEDNDGLVLLET